MEWNVADLEQLGADFISVKKLKYCVFKKKNLLRLIMTNFFCCMGLKWDLWVFKNE